MSNLPQKSPAETTGHHQKLFAQIESVFGTVPNMFKTIGHSPAALEAMWGFFGALGKGKIGAKLGEQIAVHVADLNRCEYCLSAHNVLGKNAGLSAKELTGAQGGESADPRTQAALQFAAKIVQSRGALSPADVEAVKKAGFSNEEVAELLAHVALNIFTNYTNVAFAVPVDFPRIALR